MKRKINLLVSLFLLITMVIVCGCTKKAESSNDEDAKTTIRITIGGGHPVTMSYTALYHDFFIPEINKRLENTNYAIQWTEAWGGSITSLADQYESLEAGLLDICDVGSMFEPVKTSGLSFAGYIPFNCPDPETAYYAVKKTFESFPDVVDKIYTDHNIKILTFCTTANYDFISTFEWDTIGDLKGKKVAAAGSNLNNLKGTNVITVQSSLPDAYTSFQTGVYDAWIMSPDFTVAFKLNEVAPHLKKVGFGVLISAQGMNLDTWNSLPPEVQTVFSEVADEYGEKLAQISANSSEASYAKIIADGGTVTELSEKARTEWAAMLPNIPLQWIEQESEKGYPAREIIETYFSYLEEKGCTLPRDWLK